MIPFRPFIEPKYQADYKTGVLFKISDEDPSSFHIAVPPPPGTFLRHPL